MDAISKPLISGHLQRKKKNSKFVIVFLYPVLAYRIPWVHLILNYFAYIFYLFTFDNIVYVYFYIIPIPPSLIYKQHTFLSIWFVLLSQMNFQIKSFTSFLYFSGTTSFHHVRCQITMSDVKMNTHTYFTDNTTYTMVYVRSLCLT